MKKAQDNVGWSILSLSMVIWVLMLVCQGLYIQWEGKVQPRMKCLMEKARDLVRQRYLVSMLLSIIVMTYFIFVKLDTMVREHELMGLRSRLRKPCIAQL